MKHCGMYVFICVCFSLFLEGMSIAFLIFKWSLSSSQLFRIAAVEYKKYNRPLNNAGGCGADPLHS